MLADLWNRLFGRKAREAEKAAAEEAAKQRPLPRFADYKDPFAAGVAGRYRPEELVRYTFEALEASARQTPAIPACPTRRPTSSPAVLRPMLRRWPPTPPTWPSCTAKWPTPTLRRRQQASAAFRNCGRG